VAEVENKPWKLVEPLARRLVTVTTPAPSIKNLSLVPKAVEEEILNFPVATSAPMDQS
jgi:hypothetical protein